MIIDGILDDSNWDMVKIASNSNSSNQQALKTADSWEIYDDIQFQPVLLYDLLKELHLRWSLESIIVTWNFTKPFDFIHVPTRIKTECANLIGRCNPCNSLSITVRPNSSISQKTLYCHLIFRSHIALSHTERS